MVEELRKWLKENTENAIVNRSGYDQDLTSWYTDFGIKLIWVAYGEDEHKVNSVAVELPEDRVQLVKFLLEGLDHTEECSYSGSRNLLHVYFDR